MKYYEYYIVKNLFGTAITVKRDESIFSSYSSIKSITLEFQFYVSAKEISNVLNCMWSNFNG